MYCETLSGFVRELLFAGIEKVSYGKKYNVSFSYSYME